MLKRILFSSLAAAALLSAAPAFAAGVAREERCACCSDGSSHEADHRATERAAERAQPAGEEDPFIRNQSFGG